MTNEELKQKIREDEAKSFEAYAREKLTRINILKDMGYTTDQAIKLMTCFCLEEILDVLGTPEDGGLAESIGALADCVCEAPATAYSGGYTFLRIGGSIDAGI